MAAVKLAIDEINASAAYNDRMYISYTQFNTTAQNSKTLTQTVVTPVGDVVPFTAIIGDVERETNAIIARTLNSSNSNVIQFSSNTDAALNDITQYYRLSASDAQQVDALVDFAFYYDVREVYIISSDDTYYGPTLYSRFEARAADRGIVIKDHKKIAPDTNTTNLETSIKGVLDTFTDKYWKTPITSSTYLLFVLLPTAIEAAPNGLTGRIYYDVAFANAATANGLFKAKNGISVLLSAELITRYQLSLSSGPGPTAPPFELAAALKMELCVGVQQAVGIFKSDYQISTHFPNSPLPQRNFYDSVFVIAKSLLSMLQNGTDPTIPTKFKAAVSKISFVGSSGSVAFSPNNDRTLNRFAFMQISKTKFGNSAGQVFAYWYPTQGFVPNNATYRNDTIRLDGGASNFIASRPPGMPAYVPGYWQWTPLPYSGIPPSPRFGHCVRASAVSDTMYVYSGTYSSAQSPSVDAYAYSFANSFWTQIPIGGSSKPRPSFYGFCGLYDTGGKAGGIPNALFTYGGVNTDGVKGEVWRMDVDTYAWKNIAAGVSASGANPNANSIAMDRAEAGTIQLGSKLYVLGGFRRTQDQESIMVLDIGHGDNATFTSYTPYYHPESFLQSYRKWSNEVTINDHASVNAVLEMANTLNGDPNPILATASWTDTLTKKTYTLIFIIGGGLMPKNTALIYRVEDNTIFPFFLKPNDKGFVAPDGSTAPPRDISLTVSGNYRNGYLYVSDGWSDEAQTNYREVWQLDVTCVLRDYSEAPDCGMWKWLATKPTEIRDSYRPLIYGTDIVMFGGWGVNYIHNDFYTFSLDDNQFQLVGSDYTAPSGRELHSTCLIGNLMILFGGRNTFQISQNDVWKYDIDFGTWELISPLTAPPLARFGHSAVAINIAMYVFGGTNGISTYNDLWVFSLATSHWTEIVSTSSPSARVYHTAVSYNDADMILYGGMDANANVLAEMWRYNVNSEQWVQVMSGPYSSYPIYNVTGTPDGTTGIINVNVAVIGNHFVCDMYNITMNNTAKCYPPKNVTQSVAVVSGVYMYLIGGWDSAYNSVADMCRIELASFNYPPYNQNLTTAQVLPAAYRLEGVSYVQVSLQNPKNYLWDCSLSPMPKSRNSLTAVTNGDTIFVYGGTSFELMVQTLLAYSTSTNQWLTITPKGSSLPRPRAGTSAIIYGNKFMVYGGSMAALGTIRTPTFLATEHWQYVLGPACAYSATDTNANHVLKYPRPADNATVAQIAYVPVSTDCTRCTPGTIVVGTTCQSCPAGTYSSSTTNQCVVCSAGFYNSFKGATSEQYCLPCDSGQYNPTPGASACLLCNANEYCPVATVKAQNISAADIVLSNQFQSQAVALRTLASEVADESLAIAYGTGGIVLAIGGIYLFLLFIGKSEFLVPVDILFNLTHVAHFDKPIFRRKTMMGGACTILSIFVIIYLFVSLTLPFVKDNEIESRSLVPNVSVKDNVTAAIAYNVTLSNYGQKCIANLTRRKELSSPCAKEISVELTNFGPPKGGAAVTNQSCRSWTINDIPQCSVFFFCAECMTLQVTANVTFSFAEANTYASRISWSVNSTAGYPNQNSSLWGFLKSEDQYVFRGINPPTVISTKLTPTRYKKLVTTETSLGYTQFFISQSPGSKILPKNFNSFDGIKIVFAYENQLSTLDVEVNQKLTPPQYISQLLGSISGALAGLALVLSILEEIEDLVLSRDSSPKRQKQGTHGRLDQLYGQLAETLVNAGNEEEEKAREKDANNKKSMDGKANDAHRITAPKTIKRTWALPTSPMQSGTAKTYSPPANGATDYQAPPTQNNSLNSKNEIELASRSNNYHQV